MTWLLVILLTYPDGHTSMRVYKTPYAVYVACEEDGEDTIRRMTPQLSPDYRIAYNCSPVT